MINTAISGRRMWGQEVIIFCAMFILTMLHEWMSINSFENFLKGLAFFVILYLQAQFHRFFVFKYYLLKKYFIYIIYSLVVIFLGSSILYIADFFWIQPEFADPDELLSSFLYHFVICIISTVTIMALSLMQSYATELQRRNMDQLLLNEMRLKSLHAQLNPHFFFNMLNNLYGVSLTEPERTAELIVKLSNLMRYQIENANISMVSLKDEIAFIRNYIDLERERIGKRCDIQFDWEHSADEINSYQIPPLLLIILVENSFKHSQNFSRWFVSINMAVKDDKLHIRIENSLADKSLKKNSTKVGLNNLLQRLAYIYKSDYTFSENQTAFSYQTILILPMKKS